MVFCCSLDSLWTVGVVVVVDTVDAGDVVDAVDAGCASACHLRNVAPCEEKNCEETCNYWLTPESDSAAIHQGAGGTCPSRGGVHTGNYAATYLHNDSLFVVMKLKTKTQLPC